MEIGTTEWYWTERYWEYKWSNLRDKNSVAIINKHEERGFVCRRTLGLEKPMTDPVHQHWEHIDIIPNQRNQLLRKPKTPQHLNYKRPKCTIISLGRIKLQHHITPPSGTVKIMNEHLNQKQVITNHSTRDQTTLSRRNIRGSRGANLNTSNMVKILLLILQW